MNKQTTLKIGCLNIRSLCNKVTELAIFMSTHDFDLLAINETWLDASVYDSDISIPSYEVIRNDRNRHGGGVCWYVKQGIKYKVMNNINTGIESMWLSVQVGKENVSIGTAYRPPNSDSIYFDKMLDEIDRVKSTCESLILLGDLNYNYVFEENLANCPIMYIEQLHELRQLVLSPTRVTLNSSTLLDVILSSIHDRHSETCVIQTSISDHFCVSTKLDIQAPKDYHKHRTVKYRDYKHFDQETFLNDINDCVDITNTDFDGAELDDRWQLFKTAFLKLSEKHAPFKTRRLKERHNPWINHEIVAMMYKRDFVKQQAIKHKCVNRMNDYKQLRNSLTNKIKQAKADYFKQKLTECGGNKNKVWKFISRITDKGTKVTAPDMLTAAVFNDYYLSVAQETMSLLPERDPDLLWKGPKTDKRFSFSVIQEQHVKKAFLKLCNNSNIDILGFDSKLLSIAVDVVTPVITKMFNASVIHAVIPDDWKTARVTPVYKSKGDKYDTCNYRPISVIAHLSKMFEFQVHKQLLDYMCNNHFINIDQSAYLKFSGTHTALHRVTEDFIDNVCHNVYTGVCALDIKKCFDTIDHNVLLTKLSYYGVTDSALDWFKVYLKDRSQVVRVHGDVSNKGILSMGVPQVLSWGLYCF